MNLRRQFFLLALALSLFGFAQSSANAQDTNQLYKLKAMTSNQSRLSRTEVDSSNLGALAPTQAPPPPMALAAMTQETSVPAIPADNAEPDKSYLQEYAVDWSGWIARLADRWYYVLRMNEEVVGNEFVTARPALIQFTCYNNGQIGNMVLKQTSGNPAYDRLQMIALMQAAPLPAFPQGTHRTSITLVQGWESHIKQAGEQDFVPGSFGKGFPMEKVKQWIKAK
ncbi:MAG: TonB C-terminal domain-containing protein [Cyanobacteria bacterium SZAS-4]|nr:TonB C-terminal domain-containing protein [Cyanobacteria bacterium SZAS-4]